MKRKEDAHAVLSIATLAGTIILENGGEVYRAEDTATRICESKENIKNVEVFATSNVLFVSVNFKGDIITNVIRVKNPAINLNRLKEVNNFSRWFVSNDVDLVDAKNRLVAIKEEENPSRFHMILPGTMASVAFSLLLGGGIREFIATAIASFFMLLLLEKIKEFKLTFFINTFIGAFLATLFAYITVRLNISDDLDTIVIASIMILVPGISITNAMRDTLSGDFVSGITRLMEAIVIALAIVLGVGLVLNFYIRGLI